MEAAREREPYDRGLLIVTLILLMWGIVVVLDASFARDLSSRGTNYDAFFSFKRQATWGVVSLVALALGMNVPYWRLRKFWVIGIAATILLLVAVMIPHVGITVNGSRRWLGFGPIRFQPSEFAKIALVLCLARYSELWKTRIRNLGKGFLPPVAAILVVGALVAKSDLGTAITLVGTGLFMVYMMGAQPKHMLGLFAIILLAGVLLVLKEPYRMSRIWAWLDILKDPLGIDKRHDARAYQPWLGLIAVGSGGLWGRGIGHGTVKHMYLPAEHTDYIFATIAEEFGFVWGCLPLLVLFGILVVRGLTIAHRANDWYGSLLAAGLTATIGLQAVLNVAVVSGIVPCTGVPLPFISYGGTSLVFTMLSVGMILNVSQYPSTVARTMNARARSESSPDGWRNGRTHLSGT